MSMPIDQKSYYPVGVVILAAGKGTRMKSERAKVLHSVCGRPMLSYSIMLARMVKAEKIIVVVGHQADIVRDTFKDEGLLFVEQREQLGTGHAVLQARSEFENFAGVILILCGDVPLLSIETIHHLFDCHTKEKAIVTVLTAMMDNPFGYGRVIKKSTGEVIKIVEERDASVEEKKVKEINSGIYCVDSQFLFNAVGEIRNNNAQKEYYLTDIIEIAGKRNLPVRAVIADDAEEIMGINTIEDLQRAEDRMSKTAK
ncbi:MAG: Bifunctional protein GlmU [Syntrophus sp. PtaB.Bin001]|nr:MAG: Bifunctional protein GlmU [Syntrophus sp. PtaB.Bin001]